MLNFTKFYKNSHENVCPLMICWRFTKMLALYKNVGVLEMSLYQNGGICHMFGKKVSFIITFYLPVGGQVPSLDLLLRSILPQDAE